VNERHGDVDLRPLIIIAITTAASRNVINRNNRASERTSDALLIAFLLSVSGLISFCRISRALKDGIRRNRRLGPA